MGKISIYNNSKSTYTTPNDKPGQHHTSPDNTSISKLISYSPISNEESAFPFSQEESFLTFTIKKPPISGPFKTLDEGFEYVRRYAYEHGCEVVKRRTRKNYLGDKKNCDIFCKKGKKHDYKPCEGTATRNRSSERIDCKFKWTLRKRSSKWVLTAPEATSTHNHGKMRQLTEEQFTLLCLFYSSKFKDPAKLLQSLSILYPDEDLSINLIRSSIQKFKCQLSDRLFQHAKQRQEGFSCQRRSGPGSSFIFASRASISMFSKVPTLLKVMPVTKSEILGMSVMEIFQMIHKGDEAHGLPVCLIFMKSRKQDEYDWSVEQIMQLCCKAYIPKIIISDCDANLMNSIKNIIPNTTNLLCSWMIRKRILDQLEKIAPNLLRQSRLMDMVLDTDKWNGLVHQTRTPEEFDAAFQRVSQDLANDFRPFMTYVQETWIDQHKTRFISAWTNSHTHFGFTSDDCSWFDFHGRSTLKYSYLMNNRDGFLDATIEDINTEVTRGLDLMIYEQHRRRRYDLDTTIFSDDLQFNLDSLAIDKAYIEYMKHMILQGNGIDISKCDGIFTKTMGIPCSHVLGDLYASSQKLKLSHFDKHWHRTPKTVHHSSVDLLTLTLESLSLHIDSNQIFINNLEEVGRLDPLSDSSSPATLPTSLESTSTQSSSTTNSDDISLLLAALEDLKITLLDLKTKTSGRCF